jgi:hypothetical protein
VDIEDLTITPVGVLPGSIQELHLLKMMISLMEDALPYAN